MPSSAVVDVAIGIAFVYLFLSLVCSVINEGIASIFALRSKNLVAGIDSLLSGSNLKDGQRIVEAIYSHGLIRGLYKDPPKKLSYVPNSSTTTPASATPATQKDAGTAPQATNATATAGMATPAKLAALTPELVIAQVAKLRQELPRVPVLNIIDRWFHVELPAYIPSGVFASALIDVISPPDPTKPRTLDDVRKAIALLPPSEAQQALLGLMADTSKDLTQFQKKVEAWFNDSMDRAAGWYKKRAQQTLLAIGMAITLCLNVNTIKLAEMLWTNPVARQTTVDLAQQYVDQNKGALQGQDTQDLKTRASELQTIASQLPFPFGWQTWPGWRGYQPVADKAAQNPAQNTGQNATQPSAPIDYHRMSLFWLENLIGWTMTALALSLGAPFWFDTLNKFMVVRSTVKPQEKSAPESSKDA